jgi:hypothetical protein
LTALCKRAGAVLLEGFAAGKFAVEIEVVVDRSMDGREFLQGMVSALSCVDGAVSARVNME